MTKRSLAARCRTAGHSLAECALVLSFLSAVTVAVTSVLGPQLHSFGAAVVHAIQFTWSAI